MSQIEFHSEPKIDNVKITLEPGANVIDIAARIIHDFNGFTAKMIAQNIVKTLEEDFQ